MKGLKKSFVCRFLVERLPQGDISDGTGPSIQSLSRKDKDNTTSSGSAQGSAQTAPAGSAPQKSRILSNSANNSPDRSQEHLPLQGGQQPSAQSSHGQQSTPSRASNFLFGSSRSQPQTQGQAHQGTAAHNNGSESPSIVVSTESVSDNVGIFVSFSCLCCKSASMGNPHSQRPNP